MHLRWLWGDYVEAGIDLSREDRTRVHTRINVNSGKLRNFWLIIGGMIGGGIALLQLAAPVGEFLLAKFPAMQTVTAHSLSAGAIATTYTLICILILGRLYVPIARRSMCECGVRVCVACGYDLRGAPPTTQPARSAVRIRR